MSLQKCEKSMMAYGHARQNPAAAAARITLHRRAVRRTDHDNAIPRGTSTTMPAVYLTAAANPAQKPAVPSRQLSGVAAARTPNNSATVSIVAAGTSVVR